MAQALVYEDDSNGWRTFQNGDLPNSGVTASTYGDSTHVAQVAVNAQGIVTAASNVAISAGSGTISDITSTGGDLSITAPTGPTTDIELHTSGVAAATYGSSTTVGQFAVNSKGVITSASNVSISGIAGTGLVKLFDSTLGSPAASIDTGGSGIAAGHSDILIFVMAATTQAVAESSATLTFNADSGAHYDTHRLSAAGGTVSGGTTFAATSFVLSAAGASGGTTNYPTLSLITIPSYTNTTFWKVGFLQETEMDTNSANMFTGVRGCGWRSTAAINQATLTAGSGNLVTGSRLVVYGTQ